MAQFPSTPTWPGSQIIVREMNRLGMAVDLSKASMKTMRDVLAITDSPVIFSHSSAFGLCNSSRNVHDEILKLVTKNGGLVMVNFYNKFLSCSENATVHDAVGTYESQRSALNGDEASERAVGLVNI